MTRIAATSSEAEAARCGLCGAPGRPFLVKRAADVFCCAGCGNGFAPSFAIPADLEAIYSQAYFEGGEATGYPGYLADRELLLRNFAERLAFVERARPPGRRL